MKQAVRDLENELAREKEFNASSSRLNAEYLVNVIRNFLMTKVASEHAKLVPVICSLLHFNADETRIISDKWAYNGGGLVSWLLPSMPPSLPSSAVNRNTGNSGENSEKSAKSILQNRADIYGSGVNWT